MSGKELKNKRENRMFTKRRWLSWIIAEAEYMLTPSAFTNDLLPAWQKTDNPSRYGFKKEDPFSVGSIRTRCIVLFLGCLTWLGFIAFLLWFAHAKLMRIGTAYYIGVAISLISAAGFVASQRLVRRYFLRVSPNERTGELRSEICGGILLGVILILLLALERFVIPWFAGFGFYFVFFWYAYILTILLAYLKVRRKPARPEANNPNLS